MSLKSLVCALAVMLVATLTACQTDPTLIIMVVTATPATETGTGQPVPPDATPVVSLTATQPAPAATQSAAPTVSAEANPFPTPTNREIYVAEQVFQRGRMLWLEPTGQIWVLIETEPGVGLWQVYEDTFVEGQVEFDPAIVPPEGLYQPVRGFGQVWRGNPEVRDGLGWGVETELGFVTPYEYQPAGEVVEGEFIAAPGFHFLRSFYGDWLRFNEVNGTWQLITRAEATPTPTP